MTEMGKKVKGYLGGTTRRLEVVAAIALILTLSLVNSSNETHDRDECVGSRSRLDIHVQSGTRVARATALSQTESNTR